MLVLHAFGSPWVEADGRPIGGAAGQRSRLAILATLAAAGEKGMSRDRLQTLFWPESDTERARGALKQALYALRRDLGHQDVIIGSVDLRLNPAVIATDVGEFEAALASGLLELAAQKYTGSFADGVYLKESSEFERWAERERSRLSDAYRGVLERLARKAEAASDLSAASEWWRKAAAHDPYNPSVAVSLIRTLAIAGETDRALRHGQLYRALVQDDLGAEADSEVERVVESIRRGELRPERTENSYLDARPTVSPSAAPQRGRLHRSAKWLTPLRKPVGAAIAVGLATPFLMSAWVGRVQARPSPGVVVIGTCAAGLGDDADANGALLTNRLRSGIADIGLATMRDLSIDGFSRRKSRNLDLLGAEPAARVARMAHARFVISAGCATQHDSVTVAAKIVDADSLLPIAMIEPERAATGELRGAIERIRDRTMTALAERLDPKLANWAYASRAPSNYQSYLELRLGIDAFVRGELLAAHSHFLRSAVLDTMATTPLIWAGFARQIYEKPVGDSLIEAMQRGSLRLTRWDQAMVEYLLAFEHHDLAAMHVAAHHVAAAAPNSEWRILVARSAKNIARMREALAVLDQIDASRGWLAGWDVVWITRGEARHFLGQYELLLQDLRKGPRFWPGSSFTVKGELCALAALGRVEELNRRRDQILGAQDRPNFPGLAYFQAVDELRAHGYLAAARNAADWMLTYLRTLPDSERAPGDIAHYLQVAGRLTEARAVMDSLERATPGRQLDESDLTTLGEIAAEQGDSATARRALEGIVRMPDPPVYYAQAGGSPPGVNRLLDRASILALLGEKQDAVELLAEAFRRGDAYRNAVHIWGIGMERLRGYPPYETLMKPDDRPESVF